VIDRTKFTLRTQQVLSTANEESARLQHEYIGTEHILLGLLSETEGVGVTVLHNLGVDFDALRQQVETTVKRGPPENKAMADRPFTSRTKRVLALADTEAQALGHSYVGTEHLILGLIVERMGLAG
jgi:ATP-dependent Clp protease ATP-binding subunit ClpC